MRGTEVGFQSGTRQFKEQFNTTDQAALKEMWWEFCLNEGIITYVKEAEILDD